MKIEKRQRVRVRTQTIFKMQNRTLSTISIIVVDFISFNGSSKYAVLIQSTIYAREKVPCRLAAVRHVWAGEIEFSILSFSRYIPFVV